MNKISDMQPAQKPATPAQASPVEAEATEAPAIDTQTPFPPLPPSIVAVIAEAQAEALKRDAEPMLLIKPANQWCQEAQERPDPSPLWLNLWYEGECCCLFADSNLGKSIYGVEIAAHIAQERRVLYFDFELSDKQFQLRYTSEANELHRFPDNLLRAEINPFAEVKGDFETAIMKAIEKAAEESECDVIVVDNITYLASQAEKSDEAARLMMALMSLKREHKWSMLVIAHTPKRDLQSAITQNHLGGSKKIFNFVDSCIAIGKSASQENVRYVKQLKSRSGAIQHGADNVLVCEIRKEGAFLRFTPTGEAEESEMLKSYAEAAEEELRRDVVASRAIGKSFQEIANELGISKAKAYRLAKASGFCSGSPNDEEAPKAQDDVKDFLSEL